jgi:predicted GIY-YIG superfamily endonuclease
VDVPTILYHYEWADRPTAPIYFGISNDPPARHVRHENDPDDRWWMDRSTGVMILDTQYPNRAAARAAEKAAIQRAHYAGHELANYQHNPGRRKRYAAARQARRYT